MYLASIEPNFVEEVNKAMIRSDPESLKNLGPFAFCLYNILDNGEVSRLDRSQLYNNFTVYRPAAMNKDQIERYKQLVWK